MRDHDHPPLHAELAGVPADLDSCVVVAGEGRWRYRRAEHDSHPGHVRWKEPGEMFRTLDVRAPMTLQVLQLDEAELARLLDGRPRTHFRSAQASLERPRVEGLLGRLQSLLRPGSRLEKEEVLISIVEAFFYPNLETPLRLPAARPTRAMRAVHEYIRAHFDEEIRLSTLAGLAGVHEVYLVRSFRQTYGLSPTPSRSSCASTQRGAPCWAGSAAQRRRPSAASTTRAT